MNYNIRSAIIMDNKEGTIIGIGCLALCSLYYFYRQFSKDANTYKHKRRELHKVQSYLTQHNNQLDLGSLKKDLQQVNVIIPEVTDYQLSPDTYSLRFRKVPKNSLNLVVPEGFAENQSGGRFTIMHKAQPIIVDIKNCNIETRLLQKRVEPSIIFHENRDKDALYYSLEYTIQSMRNLALYGVLKYSISEEKFILQPHFLLQALKSKEQTVDMIASFWDDKIYRITFKKLGIAFSMLTLGYIFIYRPIKNIWHRYKARAEGVSEGQFDYFKNKASFAAQTDGGLKCEFCKINTISLIYECGHLVACDDCHSVKENKKCPICNKKSKKFMKIFI